VLARELGPFGITGNAPGPTPVKTDLIRSVPQEKMQGLLPSPHGQFRDISNVINFFIQPESDFVTGQVMTSAAADAIAFLLERVSREPEREAFVWRDRVFDYRWLVVGIGHWSSELRSRIGGGRKVVTLEGDYSPNGLAQLLASIRQNGSGSTQATARCRTAEA
jgi:hypothetical protein